MSSKTTTLRRLLSTSLAVILLSVASAYSSKLHAPITSPTTRTTLTTNTLRESVSATQATTLPGPDRRTEGWFATFGSLGLMRPFGPQGPSREVRVVGTSFNQGQNGSVTIDIDAQGDENAIGLSLTFDTTKLTYVSAVAGSDTAGATVNFNTFQLASGRLGVAIAFPSGLTFTAGTRHLAVVTFQAAPTASGTADFGFGDQPIAREVADVNANTLPTTFTPGSFPINLPANPVPALTNTSPNAATVGGSAFQLTVNGSNFVNNSVVKFGTTDLVTTFVSTSQLTAQVPASAIATAGNANITVVNPPPGGGTSNAVSFAINNPLPVVTTLAPTSGSVGAGATTLTVNGSGFINGSVVRFGGSGRTTTFVNATQLTAQLTVGDLSTAGSFPITVQNAAPGGGTSNSVNFVVNNPLPAITTLSPSTVTAGSAAFTLTINGSNFVAGSIVRFNGSDQPTTFVSNSQLTVNVPASFIAVAGTLPITVFNPTPGGGASNAVNLTINNPIAVLTSLSPPSASVGGPAFTLTVNGSNFVSNSVVRFAGGNRTTTFVSSTQLTASITASDIQNTGNFAITVFNPTPGGGTSNAINLGVGNPAPTLASISPTSAITGSGAFTLTATGTNFVNGAVVRLNGADRSTTFVSATQLTAQITAADIQSAGTLSVTVFNPGPGGGLSSPVNLAVNNPTPVLASLNPATVVASPASFTLTVNGSNFVPGAVVKFGVGNRPTTFVSATQLTADITAGDVAQPGSFAISVSNPVPGGGLSNVLNLAVNNPVPVLSDISPSSVGAGDPAFTITVNGTNFINGTVVRFAGGDRTTTFVSSTQLTAAISAADVQNTGTFAITVVNPTPGGGTSGAINLTVTNPAPTLTSILPTSKTVGDPAFVLTATGSGFVNGASVRLNGTDRPTTFVDSSHLTAQISAADVQVAGTLAVTVSNPLPGGGVSSSLDLIVNNATPTVTSISPASVSAGAAAFTLTVDGTNFVNGSTVKFNGSARSTTFVSATRVTADLTAVDVANAGLVPITVENPLPGGGVSNSLSLAIQNPLPVLSSISPTTVNAGDPAFVLSLTGTDFVNGSVVRVNGSDRPTTFVDSTNLTAQVQAIDIASVGTLAVSVFNPSPGGGVSGLAGITINPPTSGTRTLRVPDTTTIAGNTVFVRIEIVAQGNENSWGFSLLFDPTKLTFVTAANGTDTPTASLIINSSAATDRVGFAGSMPAGQTLAPGVRHLLTVTFTVPFNVTPSLTDVRFTDFPISREVVDVQAAPLTTAYTSGIITIAQGYEGDVTPRPNGNVDGNVSIQDWAQIGRFMALLDSVVPGSEFQRADCAPLLTQGDGRLSVADWAQAGRFAAHLDQVPFAGGPVLATVGAAPDLQIANTSRNVKSVVRIEPGESDSGQHSLTVVLDASGTENALGFSLMFDPSRIRFESASKKTAVNDAVLQVNSINLSKGRVGFALALGVDRAFPAGRHELITITFSSPKGVEESALEFSNTPIAREVVDLKANPLRASFVTGSSLVNPIEDAQYFVQQHYLDFLGRDPDEEGLDYWTAQISRCGDNADCVRNTRIDVSAAFFMEREFQQTGFFIHRLYKTILGRQPTYSEFTIDRNQLRASSDLETEKLNLIRTWLARKDFQSRYPENLNNEQFVDALLATVQHGSGIDLASERQRLIETGLTRDRASVIRTLVDLPSLVSAEFNPAFVLSEYFGYLRRDPEPEGYEFWLRTLNYRAPNNYRAMVCAFITSEEYQRRFGAMTNFSNAQCGP